MESSKRNRGRTPSKHLTNITSTDGADVSSATVSTTSIAQAPTSTVSCLPGINPRATASSESPKAASSFPNSPASNGRSLSSPSRGSRGSGGRRRGGSPSGRWFNMAPRPQRAAAGPLPAHTGRQKAVTGQPDARNRRTLGDIGNVVTASVVHGKVQQNIGRPITQSFGTQTTIGANAAVASQSAMPPARPAAPTAAAKPGPCLQQTASVGRTGSGTAVTRARRDDVESLMRRLAVAEFEVAEQKKNVLEVIRLKDLHANDLEKIVRTQDSVISILEARCEMMDQICGSYIVLNEQLKNEVIHKATEVQEVKAQKEAELQKVKSQKEAEVQKGMEENVRLNAMVDKKEAQLQAIREQSKFMTLNHPN